MMDWPRGLWRYYLGYTKRPVHTATAALFAIFSLLVFVDPLFAVLAIAIYVVPPVVLYALEGGARTSWEPPEPTTDPATAPVERSESDFQTERTTDDALVGAQNTNTDTVDSDTDTDSDGDDSDTDTDSDSDDSDTDTDSDTDGR